MQGYHRSVLLNEAIDVLKVRDAWYLDCTLGDGGHSIEIIKRGGRVVSIDVDPQALERAHKRFKEEGIAEDKYKLIQGNFRDLKNLIQQTEAIDQKFATAIFDLGVSSLQLESPERGFSFGKVGPLDMRMDPTLQVRAQDLLKVLSRKELNELFFTLGEEKYSKRLADTLVSAREISRASLSFGNVGSEVLGLGVSNTKELADLVERVYRRAGIRDSKVHPATRAFQALRIAVNDELNALKEGLSQALDLIEKEGVIVVISFHSLEDRIVKNTFKEWETKGLGEIVTKKLVIPTEEEIEENPRSRSAKMRVFRKV